MADLVDKRKQDARKVSRGDQHGERAMVWWGPRVIDTGTSNQTQKITASAMQEGAWIIYPRLMKRATMDGQQTIVETYPFLWVSRE